ncbi:hypothetical protein [Xenorhabdus nematophila]|uniref:hypothetical protein n=1 Tax=Xenorhabdus nematophila TaxID=628 RepID=UPI0039872F3E
MSMLVLSQEPTSFFLVDNETIKQYGLEQYAHPMFGRSQHCPGILYDTAQHESNQAQGLPTNFFIH